MKLLVVGAGLSGLVAANEVQQAGHDVVVIEARDRVGGRVFTLREGMKDGQFADVGAEIIYHGQRNIAALCERFGVELSADFNFGTRTPDLFFRGQKLSTGASAEITQELRDAVSRTRPAAYETVAMWARRARVSQQAELLLQAITQSTPAAATRLADAQELNVELTWGQALRKIVGGNDTLPRMLAKHVDVRLGRPARVIGWAGRQVVVETESESFAGDRVVVTVPGPLTLTLGFDPSLPAEKVKAHLALRYGSALRIVVQYAERDLIAQALGPGCFTDGMPGFIMNQSLHLPGRAIVLTGLAAGDVEPHLETEEGILERMDAIVASLARRPVTRIFGYVKSWTHDEWSRAVVRAPIGDQRATVLPAIAAPLDGRVFFAGEHTDDRVGPGGMEGAIRSAHRVVKEILAEV
jgi:monoamine oxidase